LYPARKGRSGIASGFICRSAIHPHHELRKEARSFRASLLPLAFPRKMESKRKSPIF
jgi:hypothetical protein